MADISKIKLPNNTTYDLKGKILEVKLTNEDLNDVNTVGFYYAAGGNTVTNKPSGYNNFGLVVIHNASGSQYTQIILNENGSHRRIKKADGTWTSWVEDKFTDENVKQSVLAQTDTGWHKVIIGGTSLSEIIGNVNIVNGLNYRPSTGTFSVDSADGVADTARTNIVKIGNNKTKATANHVEGRIDLYGENGGYSTLKFDTASTSHRTHTLPNKDGTLATTDDATAGVNSIATGTSFGSLEVDTNGTVTDKTIQMTAQQQPAGQDLNDYKESGIYYFSSTTPAHQNTPFGMVNGVLIVIRNAWSARTMVKQIWMRHGTNNSNDNQIYTRSFGIANNAWSYWHELVTSKTSATDSDDSVIFEMNGRNGKAADAQAGTAAVLGETTIYVGNGTASGSDGNSRGNIRIYGTDTRYVRLTAQDTMINNYRSQLPSKSGILGLTSDIAPYESGTTASKAYAVGDYMVWRSQLYRVTSAIANGGAITNNTNVVATTVGDELKWVKKSDSISITDFTHRVEIAPKNCKEIWIGNMFLKSYTGGGTVNQNCYSQFHIVTDSIGPSGYSCFFSFFDGSSKWGSGEIVLLIDGNVIKAYVLTFWFVNRDLTNYDDPVVELKDVYYR